MIKKMLREMKDVQTVLENITEKDVKYIFHLLLKDKVLPQEEKYALLVGLWEKYSELSGDLYEIILLKIFQYKPSNEIYNQLVDLYKKDGKYKELIQLMDYYSTVVEEDLMKAQIFSKLGDYYKDIFLDPSTSLEFFKKAQEIEPENDDISEAVEDLIMDQDNWETIVKNFEEKVDEIDDPTTKSIMCLNITKTHLNHSKDIEKAKFYLKQAIELYPLNDDIPLLIIKIFVDNNYIDEIIDILTDAYKKEGSSFKNEYLTLLKNIFNDERVIAKKGFSVYENLVSLEPENFTIFENAVNYALENNRHKELLSFAEKIAESNLSKELQIYYVNFMAEFAFDYLDDLEKAERYAKKSQRLDPKNFKYDYIYLEYYKFIGNTRKVLEVLNKKLRETKESDQQIEIYQEIADVAESAQNIFKATDSYKAILKLDPDNVDAKDSLKRIYRDGKKWRALIELLKNEISTLEKKEDMNNEEIVELYEELIDLNINQLKQDPTLLYKKVLNYDPANLSALNFLLEKNRSTGRWNEYIKILSQKGEVVDDETLKIDIFFEISDIYSNNLKKPLEATVYFEKILDIDPSNGDALDRLKEIYNSSKKYEKLYYVLLKEVDLSNSTDAKIDNLIKIFHFVSEHLKKDGDLILKTIENILSIDSENIFALERKLELAENSDQLDKQEEILSTLYSLDKTDSYILKLAKINDQKEDFEKAIQFYKEYLNLNLENEEVNKRVVDIYLSLDMFEDIDQLFELIEKWDQYYNTIYRIIEKANSVELKKDYNLKAISIAENFLNNQDKVKNSLINYNENFGDSIAILDKLYQIFHTENDMDSVFSVLNKKLTLIEDNEEKLQLYNELTALYMEVERYTDAFKNEKIKFLLNKDTSILDNLAELSIELNNQELLANTFIEIINEIDDNILIENIYKRTINIYNELGRYDDSKDLYFKLIEVKPNNKTYVENLIDILVLLEDYQSLDKAYNLKLNFLENGDKIALLQEMATNSFEKLNNPDLSKEYLENILSIDSQNIPALNMLLFIYSSIKDYKNWIKIAILKSQFIPENELKELYFKIAEIYRNELNDKENFTIFAQKRVDLDSKDEILIELEKILQVDNYLPLADIILSTHNLNGNFEEQKRVLNQIIDNFNLDQYSSFKYRLQLSELLQNNFEQYKEAYDIKKDLYLKDPSNNDLLNGLEFLSDKIGDFTDLISTLLKLKDEVKEKMSRINILARLGKIYDFYRSEHETAQQYYNQILEEDNQNIEVLNALEKIYFDSQNYEMLYKILKEKNRLLDEDDKILNQVNMAKVKGLYFEQIDEAMNDLNRLLEIDDEIIEVYNVKKLFYQKLDQYENVLEVLFKLESLLKNDSEKLFEILLEVASIYNLQNSQNLVVDHFLDTHDILDQDYQKRLRDSILENFNNSSSILEEYETSYIKFLTNRKLWKDLIQFYNLIIDKTKNREIKENRYKDISTIYIDQLSDKENSITALYNVLFYTLDDNNIMENIINSTDDIDSIIENFIDVAEKKEDNWKIYYKIAELFDLKEDIENKKLYYLKAYKSNSINDDLFNLVVEIYQTDENYEILKDIYLLRASSINDIDLKVELLNQSATLLIDFIYDKDGAAKVYENIYDLTKSESVLLNLESLYTDMEYWDKLALIFSKAIDNLEVFETKKIYLEKIVNIFISKLNDPSKSKPYLYIMIKHEPTVSENYIKLQKILIEEENYGEIDKLYTLELEHVIEDERKGELLLNRAINANEKLNNKDISISSLEELVQMDPYNEESIKYLENFLNIEEYIIPVGKILEPIYELKGEWETLVNLLKSILNQKPENYKEILLKIAEIYKNNLENFDEALNYSLYYFLEDPANSENIDSILGLLDVTSKYTLFIEYIDKLLETEEEITETAEEETAETAEEETAETAEEETTETAEEETAETAEEETAETAEEETAETAEEETAETAEEETAKTSEEEKKVLDIEIKRSILNYKVDISENYIEDKNILIKGLFQIKDVDKNNIEWYDKLNIYLTETGDFTRLIDLLKDQIEITEEQSEKISLLFKISDIYKNQLNNIPKAIDAYEMILTYENDNSLVFEELEIILEENISEEITIRTIIILEKAYKENSYWEQFVEVLNKKLKITKDNSDKKTIYLNIGEIYNSELMDQYKGFENYTKAFEIDLSKDTAEKIIYLTEQLGNFEEFINFIEPLLVKIEEKELQQLLFSKLGYILFDFIGDIDKANNYFLKVDTHKENIDILKKLEIIYQEKTEFKNLESVYFNQIPLLEDGEKIETLLKLANLQEFELQNLESTKKTYENIIVIDPKHIDSLNSLERLNQNNNEKLTEIYQLKLNCESIKDEARVDVLFKLADIYKVDENDDAELLWKEILDIGFQKKNSYLNLISHYTKREKWSELVDTYESFLTEFEMDLETEDLINMYDKLAAIYYDEEKLNSPSFALQNYQKILSLEPQYIKALIYAKEIYKKFDSLDEQFEAIRQIILTLENSLEDKNSGYTDTIAIKLMNSMELDIKNSLIEYYNEFELLLLDNMAFDEMINIAVKHLELEPKNRDVILRLEEVYEKQGLYEELIYILDKKLSISTGDEERTAIYKKIAEISINNLGDNNKAIESYKSILLISENNIDIIEKLEKIYENLDQWYDVIETLELKIKVIEDTYSSYLRIVDIIIEYIGDFDMGFKYISKAFSIFNNDETLFNLLNKMGELSMMWESYISTSRKVLANVTDNGLRDQILFKMASVYKDDMGELEKAVETYQLLSSYLPNDRDILINLENLHLMLSNWEELALTIEKIISIEQDEDIKREYLYKLASHYEDNLSNISKSADVYERVVTLYPTEMDALDQLERIYLDIEKQDNLIKVYLKKIDIVDSPSNKIELYEKIAYIAQELENKELLIKTYRSIILLDNENRDAFTILKDYYTENDIYDPFLEILNFLIESNSNFLIDALLLKASIIETQYNKQEEAIEIYKEIIESIQPENKEASKELIRIYKSKESWDDLIELYKMLLDIEDDKDRRVDMLNQISFIYLLHLKDYDYAREYFEYTLSEDTSNQKAIDGLMKIFTINESWYEAIDLLSSVATSTQDVEQASNAYFQIGMIYFDKLDSIPEAKVAFEGAIASKYDHVEALLKLKKIAYQEEDYESIVNYLENLREFIEDDDKKISINNELGTIFYKNLNDYSNAIYSFEASVDIKANKLAVEFLTELYFKSQMFDYLSDIYDNHIDLILKDSTIPPITHYYWNSFAKFSIDKDSETVFKYAIKSFELNKLSYETLSLLYKVSFNIKNYEVLISCSKQMLVHYFDKYDLSELGDIYVKLGISYAGIENFDKSNHYFNRALTIDPYNVEALKFAVEAYKKGGQWLNVIEYLTKISENSVSQDEKIKINYEIGTIYKNELKNNKKALPYLLNVVNSGVKNRELLNHLYDIYVSIGDYKNVINVLEEILKMEKNEEEYIKICYKVADLFYTKFKDVENSIKYLLNILSRNYRNNKVLSTIEQILEPAKGYSKLEEIYRGILSKLSDKDLNLKLHIFEKLGFIYKDVMDNYTKAIEVYEILFSMKPNDNKYYKILIDFYERIPQYYDKAIVLHKKNISKSLSQSIDSLHSLVKLYGEKKVYDRVFSYCSILYQMGAVQDDEKEFYLNYKPITIPKLQRTLGDHELQKYIYQKNMSKDMLDIFSSSSSIIEDFYRDKKLKHIKDIDYKKDKISEQTRLYKTASSIIEALGLERFEFYHSKSGFKGIRIEVVKPSTVLIVGTDLMSDRDDTETAFYLGKHLFYLTKQLRPLSVAKSANVDPYSFIQEMQALFSGGQFLNKKLFKEFKKRLSSAIGINIENINKEKLATQTGFYNWLKDVELSANRVGLLLSGDINSAIKVIKEDKPLSNASIKDKIDDLQQFAISDTFFKLRESLGISIKVK